ncbi:hypothetical protein G9C85_11545 [Halorubellus sp. JP-L1]|uniref:hypothetical protein n=1 Tax=Halorubellus sp. JP-L1 TaxID=2715753 RepID=UPI00140B7D37|nr:hypothetical protein [Halorubellus sp. JP-L1]NHN42254.1 hypothetical protein [Halorubellus sp. JP-L1]
MIDDVDEPEPWLPVPVMVILMVASIVLGALATVSVVDSPAAALDMLSDPFFYVLLGVVGGTASLVAFARAE